jgi:hypothetical protein
VTEQVVPPAAPPEIYIGGAKRGARKHSKAALNIIGRSGCGKSHCAVTQFINDPAYGPNEVLIAMAENSTSSYGDDAMVSKLAIEDVESPEDVSALINDLTNAFKKGKRIPKLFVLDDLSILSQKMRRYFDQNPLTGADGVSRDTRSEFRVKGYSLIDVLMDIRTVLPIDSVTLIRSHEGAFNAAPEIALEGNIAPKNLTGMSSITLYMKAEAPKFTPAQVIDAYQKKVLFQPHRTVAATEEEIQAAMAVAKGGGEPNFDTTIISRFFVTMNTGEIEAKGHHALRLKEKAYLPGVLRKIHGEKPLTTWG